jgi:hypothetical protein
LALTLLKEGVDEINGGNVMFFKKNIKLTLFVGVFLLQACGRWEVVHAETTDDAPRYDAVQYNIFELDNNGYIMETLTTDCISLEDDSFQSVTVESKFYYGDTLTFTSKVRGGRLELRLTEDEDLIHAAHYRPDYFNLNMVEQKVETNQGALYMVEVSGSRCRPYE